LKRIRAANFDVVQKVTGYTTRTMERDLGANERDFNRKPIGGF